MILVLHILCLLGRHRRVFTRKMELTATTLKKILTSVQKRVGFYARDTTRRYPTDASTKGAKSITAFRAPCATPVYGPVHGPT